MSHNKLLSSVQSTIQKKCGEGGEESCRRSNSGYRNRRKETGKWAKDVVRPFFFEKVWCTDFCRNFCVPKHCTCATHDLRNSEVVIFLVFAIWKIFALQEEVNREIFFVQAKLDVTIFFRFERFCLV